MNMALEYRLGDFDTVHLVRGPIDFLFLKSLGAGAVWIEWNESNEQAVEEYKTYTESIGMKHLYDNVTLFTPVGMSEEDVLRNVLEDIEDHHGEFAQSRPYSAIVACGFSLNEEITEILQDWGFGSVRSAEKGFIATRRD